VHPILGHPRRLAFYLLAWVLIGLLLSVGLGRGTNALLAAVLFFVPLTLLYGFVTLSAWYVCRVSPLQRSRVWQVAVVHMAAAAIASASWVGAAGGWSRALMAWGIGPAGGVLAETPDGGVFVAYRPVLFVVGVLLFWLSVIVSYLLMAFEASREAERRNLELGLLAREAELKALRAQIDPHFIFNSLHSISALTATDPPAARRMCLLLADFLRETLRLGASGQIPLGEEFALADRFLAIEQIRLGARLNVARETDLAAEGCLVPPLLLQPLVENAVNHGVAQLVEGGTIHIAARRAGETLTITMENPCDPERSRSRGVGLGLELLRKRLTSQYGASDAVHAREQEGRFRVEVRIPAVTEV
jgi:two-component system sensor histidine kinase AlgZ